MTCPVHLSFWPNESTKWNELQYTASSEPESYVSWNNSCVAENNSFLHPVLIKIYNICITALINFQFNIHLYLHSKSLFIQFGITLPSTYNYTRFLFCKTNIYVLTLALAGDFFITRPGRGGVNGTPGVSKLSVVALRNKDQKIALNDYSWLKRRYLSQMNSRYEFRASRNSYRHEQHMNLPYRLI